MEFTSSSSSKSKHQQVYDVLINFSGEDIRRKFVSHLHSALSDAGINTFLYEEENLVKGMQIEELMQARDMSPIAIVVFTKPYFESAWCLDELVKIIEWHQTYCRSVLPVFYGIDPSDVRYQKGDSGKALKETAEKSFSGEELQYVLSRWSRALTKAASFYGWDESNYRNDAELVEKIVKGVRNMPVLSTVKFPVGLLSRVEEVIRLIEKQSTSTEVSMIGICGMEGIGKTTLAKAVYNHIHSTFVYKSFIQDIKEVSRTKGHVHLQEQLHSKVLQSKVRIQSIEKGRIMIKERFSGKRVFIVLDDVDQLEQLYVLCGNHYQRFGQGSVIIITARNRDVIGKLEDYTIYEMRSLNNKESLELLSWHAFREAKPRQDFNELARNVIRYSAKLPLPVEVLGSYLFERTEEEWKSLLSKFKEAQSQPQHRILKILKICYDGLHDMERDMFLNICFFFIGKDKTYATEIINGCGLDANIGITNLIDRGFIKVKNNNKLGMHPLLQDMGREIIFQSSARKLGKQIRLWFHKEVPDVLTKNTVFGWLKILNLSHFKYLTETQIFSRLRSLEKSILKDRPKLCKINQSIGDLCNLLLIDLKDYTNLSNLPIERYQLKFLKTLIRCFKIDILKKDMENNNWGDLVPMLSNLPNLRSVLVHCDTEFQLSKQVNNILVEYGVNVNSLRISEHQLRSSLIGMGSYKEFFNTLSNIISEGLEFSESCDVSLPGDNDPYWLAHMGEGHSVYFTVPENCCIKGMTLCVVYSSSPQFMPTKCLTSFIIVNYTKCTFQIHKLDRDVSLNDEDWPGIISNLGSGNKVEIFVSFEHRMKVKKTAIYLMCGESNDMEMETFPEPKENALIRFIRKVVMCDYW